MAVLQLAPSNENPICDSADPEIASGMSTPTGLSSGIGTGDPEYEVVTLAPGLRARYVVDMIQATQIPLVAFNQPSRGVERRIQSDRVRLQRFVKKPRQCNGRAPQLRRSFFLQLPTLLTGKTAPTLGSSSESNTAK